MATEEYIAGLAEDGSFKNVMSRWWQKLKGLFMDFLRSCGFSGNMKISDNELRYVLWMSYENLREPGRFKGILGTAARTAARVAKEHELGVGEFAEENSRHQNRDEDLRYSNKETVNQKDVRYNYELKIWAEGEMRASDHISLGKPSGIMERFMPEREIILRQKVLSKARKKHGLSEKEMRNMPSALSHPIFVFKSEEGSVGVLTELKSDEGQNIFAAVKIGTNKQLGHEIVEVNDIASIHGREIANIVKPIIENGTLRWLYKKKGLAWLSSAKTNSQAIVTETKRI
ncbi:MAG: hypothetical protein K2M37_07275 [Muribaculaceae bacterium]|nr:hypothetical protein [Muribaculaceae bacterium]